MLSEIGMEGVGGRGCSGEGRGIFAARGWTWTESRTHCSDSQVTEQRYLDVHPRYWKLVWKVEEALAKAEESLEQNSCGRTQTESRSHCLDSQVCYESAKIAI